MLGKLTAARDEAEQPNIRVVLSFYEALTSRDSHTIHTLLAPHLEWWFHGPPSHQFLTRLLTGSPSDGSDFSFEFSPLSIVAFGSLVIAEGCNPSRSISWVHAWTVNEGIITQVREYFNTSVTVTRLASQTQSQPSDLIHSSHHDQYRCQPLWVSSLSNRAGKSVPGLVLAL